MNAETAMRAWRREVLCCCIPGGANSFRGDICIVSESRLGIYQ